MFLILFFVFGLFLLIDFYTYQAIKTTFSQNNIIKWGYWLFTLATLAYMLNAVSGFDRAADNYKVVNSFMGIMVLVYVPKLFVVMFLFSEDMVRITTGAFAFLSDFFTRNNTSSTTAFMADRRKFVSQIGLLLAAVPLTSILYGIVKGRYNFKVIKQAIFFDDLPDAFDGFTITQISDIHSGSFDNPEKVAYAIDLINDQKSDLLVFTGDLVNNKAEEMDPWMDTFNKLNMPEHGMFSILGNHDYGDYATWKTELDKKQNLDRVKEIHGEIGFKLLLDEKVTLRKNGEEIDLIGIENWGAGGFAKYGDFEKAIANSAQNNFRVLLSHDPSHYDSQVKNHNKKVDLTLSGHTHGMQFGIEIPGFFKWSPIKYRYPKWAGLYEENKRYLYVNRGFGYLAFPGRVGIWPEITVLELKKKTV